MAGDHTDIALTPPSTPPSPQVAVLESTDFADVFSTSRSPSPNAPFSIQHPTDIPRLRATHVTAGYRDGISVSKEPAIQPGFDEGYPLGATFGLTVGYLLGTLEGILAAQGGSSTDRRGNEQRLRNVLMLAKRDLCVEEIFGKAVWKSDGTWGYSVAGEEMGDVTWKEIVEAHPIVTKWEEIVREEVRRAGVEMGKFEGPEWEAGRVCDDEEVASSQVK